MKKHDWQVNASIVFQKSVLLTHTNLYEFDGHNIHISHNNWTKVLCHKAYASNDKTHPRMWILVEDKLINAPVIIN